MMVLMVDDNHLLIKKKKKIGNDIFSFRIKKKDESSWILL
jgi:hypothetical protein